MRGTYGISAQARSLLETAACKAKLFSRCPKLVDIAGLGMPDSGGSKQALKRFEHHKLRYCASFMLSSNSEACFCKPKLLTHPKISLF